jgi:hypothetical protein
MSTLTELSDLLVERFGTGYTESGTAPTSPEITMHYAWGRTAGSAEQLIGRRTWSRDDQVVEENFLLSCGNLLVAVSYRPKRKNGF